jgi:hydroxyacyl-ACP dehydratase HTD2-like protein with hotdog domain
MTMRARSAPRVGDTLPIAVHEVTRLGIFLFGAAHWTAHRIHYHLELARDEGFADVVVTGALMSGWTMQLLTEWAGEPLCVREVVERNVASAVAGDTITITGSVTDVEDGDDGTAVACSIVVSRQDGTAVVRGTARLLLAN